MKIDLKLAVAIILTTLVAGGVIAEVTTSDRSKADPELTRTLNGSDHWITTIRHHFDGGTAEAVCQTVGYGRNIMCWCDGRGYMMNTAGATNPDAGTLQVEEMIPVGPQEKYGIGITGSALDQICIRQDRLQDDAGSVVRCPCFRRY